MLQTLLALIHEGQGKNQQELARALHVPEAMVMHMTEQLDRQGYLIEAQSRAGGCHSCALKSACGSQRQLRAWTLTDRGYAALERYTMTEKE